MRNAGTAMVMALLVPTFAAAEPVSGKDARKMLFAPRGIDVQIPGDSGLTSVQREYLKKLVTTREFKNAVSYYGALAISPSFYKRLETDGDAAALSGLFQIVSKYHSPAAAAGAALGACDAARKGDDQPCVVGVRILPKRWKARDVSLSIDATAAMKVYRKGDGPRAMAVSTGSEAYAIAKGEGAPNAALVACNRNASKVGSPDCKVLIADDD